MRYSALRQTGIPEKTLDRILEEFRVLGIIEKVNGYWRLKSETPYKTKDEYDIALQHSKKLLIGLEAILAEDRLGWQPLIGRGDLLAKVEEEGELAKPFAEAHLRTGYPNIYKKLVEYRELNAKIKKDLVEGGYPLEIVDFVVKGKKSLSANFNDYKQKLKELEGVIKQKLEAYSKLMNEVRSLQVMVRLGKPLGGFCRACPNFNILG